MTMQAVGEAVRGRLLVRRPASSKPARPRWQHLAYRVAAKLKDFKHVAVYLFWCRWYTESVVETALLRTLEAGEKKDLTNPAAYYTNRLMAIGGPLPAEAYEKRRRKPIKPQLKFKL